MGAALYDVYDDAVRLRLPITSLFGFPCFYQSQCTIRFQMIHLSWARAAPLDDLRKPGNVYVCFLFFNPGCLCAQLGNSAVSSDFSKQSVAQSVVSTLSLQALPALKAI